MFVSLTVKSVGLFVVIFTIDGHDVGTGTASSGNYNCILD